MHPSTEEDKPICVQCGSKRNEKIPFLYFFNLMLLTAYAVVSSKIFVCPTMHIFNDNHC